MDSNPSFVGCKINCLFFLKFLVNSVKNIDIDIMAMRDNASKIVQTNTRFPDIFHVNVSGACIHQPAIGQFDKDRNAILCEENISDIVVSSIRRVIFTFLVLVENMESLRTGDRKPQCTVSLPSPRGDGIICMVFRFFSGCWTVCS